MSEHFTPEEIEQFDVTRFARFIEYRRKGRSPVVAGLLAKTMMPHVEGLPATAEQVVAQKELAEALAKSAETDGDREVIAGVGAIAQILVERAIDEGQRRYWTMIAVEAVDAFEAADPRDDLPDKRLERQLQANGYSPEQAKARVDAIAAIINAPPRRGLFRRRK
jgi:hypothetical protein